MLSYEHSLAEASTSGPRPAAAGHDAGTTTRGTKLSCLPCRKRKSKCDRGEPCSSCVLRSTESFCYTVSELPEGSAVASRSSKIIGDRQAGMIGPSTSGREDASPTSANGVDRSPREDPSGAPRSAKRSRFNTNDFAAQSSSATETPSPRPNLPPTPSSSSHTGASTAPADLISVRSMLSSIRANLESVEKAIPALASGSSAVPEATGRDLRWADLAPHLPSPDDCVTLFQCFFTELDWHVSCLHSGTFFWVWQQLQAGHRISRYSAAIFYTVVALTLALRPRAHKAARITQTPHSHSEYTARAHQLLQPQAAPEDSGLNFTRLQAETCICLYQVLAGGHDGTEKAWYYAGAAIRRGKALQLFDEGHWRSWEMSALQKELWRRVAHSLATLDRWLGVLYQRMMDLEAPIAVEQPEYVSADCWDTTTGARIEPKTASPNSAAYLVSQNQYSEVILQLNRFLRTLATTPQAERYTAAMAIDARLVESDARLPRELHFENARANMTPNDPASHVVAAQAIVRHCSTRYLRCSLMRPFLLDRAAPLNLRYAALEHARKILETMPTLVTLASCPWVAFQTSWNSQHLFVAATTFATVFLDDRDDKQMWPAADLDWFSSQVFEAIETLSLLSESNVTARISHQLLIGLCTSRDLLRERFQARRREAPSMRSSRPARADQLPAVLRMQGAASTSGIAASSMSPPLPGSMAPPMSANAARTMNNPAPGAPHLPNAGSADWSGGTDPLSILDRFPAGPEDGTDWLSLDNLDWAELTAHLSTADGQAFSMMGANAGQPAQ